MDAASITAGCFILFGLLCIYLFNKKTSKKNKTYWVPKMETHLPLPKEPMFIAGNNPVIQTLLQADHTLNPLYVGSKDLGTAASKIELIYPVLRNTIDQIRELQGCLYLMHNYLKEGTRTPTEIRDYETYLLKKYYENQAQPIDIPTMNRQ